MFDRQGHRRSSPRARRPLLENLESRQLLAASIEPLAPAYNVWQFQSLQVPLAGGPGASNQTYTVTTNNSNIKATIAQGKFLTVGVSHASSGAGDISFTGNLVFQLFDDLTPLTTSRIEQLVQQGFYNGRTFHRVANLTDPSVPNVNNFIVQGGSVNGNGTGEVPEPGFPFQDEFVKQLTFTNPGQLAMANAGRDTNSSQFFVTDNVPWFLDMRHTIFGQLVEGAPLLTDMTMVKRDTSDTPVSPITITSATLSDTSPDGDIHIDATNAQVAIPTTVTVTATDPTTHTTATRSFVVTVVPPPNVPESPQPSPPPPNPAFVPLNVPAFLPPVNTDPVIGPNQTYTVQLAGMDNEPTDQVIYQVMGTVSANTSSGGLQFNPVSNASASVSPTGLVTVTPNSGFTGDIPLTFAVRDNEHPTQPASDPASWDYHNVTLHVVNQNNAVRLVGKVLVVTPPPRTDGGTNTISVEQMGGNIVTIVNGVASPIVPAATAVDSIVLYGTKANDNIQVAPTVDASIPVLLDGGHGGVNFLKAGQGSAREHGWFGFNTLIGGPGDDALIGQRGHVKFVQSAGTDVLFTGVIPPLRHRSSHHRRVRIHHFEPPSGTFYHFANGRVVPGGPGAAAASGSNTGTSGTGTGSGSGTGAASQAAIRAAALRAARAASFSGQAKPNPPKPSGSSGY